MVFGGDLFLGVKVRVTTRLAFRADLQDNIAFESGEIDDMHNISFAAGLEYRFSIGPLPIGRLPALDLRVGVARILEEDPNPLIGVVLSACRGITDALLNVVAAAERQDEGVERRIEEIRKRHQGIADTLLRSVFGGKDGGQ